MRFVIAGVIAVLLLPAVALAQPTPEPTTTAPSEASDPPRLQLIDASGNPLDRLDLQVAPGATAVAATAAVRLAAGSAPTTIGPVRLQMSAPLAGQVIVGGDDQAAVVTGGGDLQLALDVTGVTDPGAYAGFLEAVVGSRTVVLAPVLVTKAPEATLGGPIVATTSDRTITFVVTVRNAARTPATGLTLDLSTPTTSGGAAADDVQIADGGEVDVPPGGVIQQRVSMVLPAIATYQGSLRLLRDGVIVDAADVALTREAASLPVTVAAPGPFRATSVWPFDRSVPVALAIGEDSGLARTVTVTASVSRTGDDEAEALPGVHLAATCTADPQPAGVVLELSGLGTTRLDAELCDLPTHGTFQITFTLSSADRQRTTETATLTIRRGWPWAVVFLLLGIGLAAGVQRLRRRRSDAVPLQELTWAERQLAALPPPQHPDDQRLVLLVQEEVTQARRSRAFGGTPVLVVKARLLAACLQLRSRLRAEELEQTAALAVVSAFIAKPDATADDATAALGTIYTAATEADRSVAAVRLLRQVEAALADTPESSALVDLRTAAASARDNLLVQDGTTPEAVRGLVRTLAVALANQLREGLLLPIVSQSKDSADWEGKERSWRQRLKHFDDAEDPALVVLLHQTLLEDMVRFQAEHLQEIAEGRVREWDAQIRALRAAGADPAEIAQAEQARTAADDASKAAGRAVRVLDAEDLQAAIALLESGVDRFAVSGGGGLERATGASPTVVLSSQPPRAQPSAPTLVPTAPSAEVPGWIVAGEGAVAAVIALLLGLSALYVGQPAWGGFADLVAAALWGFGLNTTAVAGLQSVREALLGTQDPAG